MEITGKQLIAAPRTMVWDALNDPVILKQCLPGCETVERVAPDEFKVVLAAAIGPLRAKFNGKLRIADAEAPQYCTMVFEGQGGAVGFGKGASEVQLTETPEGTELAYVAKAQVGGKLAQVGSRLIDSVAKKMSDDFFNAFRKQVQPQTAEVACGTDAALTPDPAPEARNPAADTALAVPAMRAASATAPVLPAARATGSSSGIAAGSATVPAWWLPVAAFVGAACAIAGSVLIR